MMPSSTEIFIWIKAWLGQVSLAIKLCSSSPIFTHPYRAVLTKLSIKVTSENLSFQNVFESQKPLFNWKWTTICRRLAQSWLYQRRFLKPIVEIGCVEIPWNRKYFAELRLNCRLHVHRNSKSKSPKIYKLLIKHSNPNRLFEDCIYFTNLDKRFFMQAEKLWNKRFRSERC